MGTAILGTVLFVTLTPRPRPGSRRWVPAEQAQQLADVVEKSAGTVIPGLDQPPGGPELQAAAGQAFAESLSRTAFVAGGFVFLGLVFTLALPKTSGRHEQEELSIPAAEPAAAAGPDPDQAGPTST